LKKCLLLTLVFLALGMAFPASAAIGDGNKQPFQNDVVDPCPTYDSCTMFRTTYTNMGPTLVPAACKQSSCRYCNTSNRCQSIAYSGGNCTCTDLNSQGAPGITYCANQYGSCVVN
jgi:hypothetical protein